MPGQDAEFDMPSSCDNNNNCHGVHDDSDAHDRWRQSVSHHCHESNDMEFLYKYDPVHDNCHRDAVTFSCICGGSNITFTSMVYCQDGESDHSRWAHLAKIAKKDIPESRHGNGTTLKHTEKIDMELPCISVSKFVARCAMNVIYMPPLSVFTKHPAWGMNLKEMLFLQRSTMIFSICFALERKVYFM